MFPLTHSCTHHLFHSHLLSYVCFWTALLSSSRGQLQINSKVWTIAQSRRRLLEDRPPPLSCPPPERQSSCLAATRTAEYCLSFCRCCLLCSVVFPLTCSCTHHLFHSHPIICPLTETHCRATPGEQCQTEPGTCYLSSLKAVLRRPTASAAMRTPQSVSRPV